MTRLRPSPARMGRSWDGSSWYSFGIGSSFAWQAYANVCFRASDLVGIVVGYRAIDLDYEEGSGDDSFRYDVLDSGPQIGATFRF